MSHPTFSELADDLVSHHPPKTPEVGRVLDSVRNSFRDLIESLSRLVPEGPDATIAARRIHDACQACIFAVVHNQEDQKP